MTSQDPQCDPISGTCTLPPPNEKTQPQTSNKGLSTLDIFRNANVTTLNNDKGDPVPIDSLPPSRLVLLYCSAVLTPARPFLPPQQANDSSRGVHPVVPLLLNFPPS